MRLDIEISYKGLLTKAPQSARQRIWRDMRPAIDMAANEMVAGIVKFTPVGATGALRRGIHADVNILPGMIVGLVQPTEAYAPAVELGTKAHWAPLPPLEYWVRRKLRISGARSKGVARAIQLRIAGRARGRPGGTSIHSLRTTGTWGYLMFMRGFKARKSRARRIIQQYLSAAVRRLGGK